jgi:hypothetical protein
MLSFPADTEIKMVNLSLNINQILSFAIQQSALINAIYNCNSMAIYCRGIGKLIADCSKKNVYPIVQPFVHSGMERLIPLHQHFPNFGQEINILCGDRIEYRDLIENYNSILADNPLNADIFPQELLYIQITERIEQSLDKLQRELAEKILQKP